MHRFSILIVIIIMISCQSNQNQEKMIGLFKKKQEEPTRKERTEKLLKSKGIKINQNLPLVETESETTLRTPQEIAERVSILAVTNLVAYNNVDAQNAIEYLKKYNMWDKVTPNEKDFLNNPTDERKTHETWKCEGIWTLLWALKIVPDLEFPDHFCDLKTVSPDNYPIGAGKDPNDFIKKFSSIRSKTEILDAVDLYYRIDWACVDARINGKVLNIVDCGVVYERHYALNWLVRYSDQEWDDITCDT